MKKLILGTKNPAKTDQVRSALRPLGVEVETLPDREFPEIMEDGLNIQENARKKATTYAQTLGQAVLSMDNALYFADLSENLQPGQNVRRINGRSDRPSDDELLDYYQGLVAAQGGKIMGHWEYAFCYAWPDSRTIETVIKMPPRIFSATRSKNLVPGYPLESLQIDPDTGRYLTDLSTSEREIFWQNKIGVPLREFIKSIPD